MRARGLQLGGEKNFTCERGEVGDDISEYPQAVTTLALTPKLKPTELERPSCS